MSPILEGCRRAPSLEGVGPLAVLMVVVNLEWYLFVDFVLEGPTWAHRVGYPFHVALLGALGAVYLLWTAGFIMGRVGASTGAGLRIACLGLVARLLGQFPMVIFGFDSLGRSVYDAFPSIGGYVWLLRNIGLAAYAYGIAFVALSCWSERRLRRTAPAWVLPS